MLVTHDMATVQSALRPGDADPRRRAALHRRSRGDGAALLPAELRAARTAHGRDGRGRRAGRQRRGSSTPGSRTRPASGVENVEQGEPIAPRGRARGARATSSAPVFGFHVVNADGATGVRLQPHARSDGEPTDRRPGERVRHRGRRSRTRCVPGRYFVELLDRAQTATQGDRGAAGACGCSTSSSTGRAARPGMRRRSTPTSRPCSTWP